MRDKEATTTYQLTVTLHFATDLPNGPYAILNGPAKTAEVYIGQETGRTLADVKQTIESSAAKVTPSYRFRSAVFSMFSSRLCILALRCASGLGSEIRRRRLRQRRRALDRLQGRRSDAQHASHQLPHR